MSRAAKPRAFAKQKSLEGRDVVGGNFFCIKKLPATSYSRTGESRTTLGDGELDFCVRNGNRYDFSSMVTGKNRLVGNLRELQLSRCESLMISH